MSRVKFKTGKAHQEAAATWARRRLADRNGRRFSSPKDQDGVLFADGVGMGKTWEALAAAALLLYKSRLRRRRHVLILCPPNLITKWEDELAAGSPFQECLKKWAAGIRSPQGGRYAKCVLDTLSYTLPIRHGRDVATKLRAGRFEIPGGTYLISQRLIGRPSRGLAALRKKAWDIVIVDEAHNAAAGSAIAELERKRRSSTKLLLSATPFQLEPKQWNLLAKHLIKGKQKMLARPEVRTYLDKVAKVFSDPLEPGPKSGDVEEASATLRKLVARSVFRNASRRYGLIRLDGTESLLSTRLDQLDDETVKRLVRSPSSDSLTELGTFSREYLSKRLELTKQSEATFIATELRRFLSKGTPRSDSPRLVALDTWARRNLEADIELSLQLGIPHKMIVFSSWVGEKDEGEAEILRKKLALAFDSALSACRERIHSWNRLRELGRRRLLDYASQYGAIGPYAALAEDELTAVLCGAKRRFLEHVREPAFRHSSAVEAAKDAFKSIDSRTSIEARAIKRRWNDARAALNPWASGTLNMVCRYTGAESRLDRDRAATAFRQVGPPWVLVASQVGSEGIDLHVFTHRVVHYDLEWNPARMEQREGRGDRVGRQLRSPLNVSYILVPGTYDERMFHQLVARDRWHGVLLGKASKSLDTSEDTAPLLDARRLEKMRLRLEP